MQGLRSHAAVIAHELPFILTQAMIFPLYTWTRHSMHVLPLRFISPSQAYYSRFQTYVGSINISKHASIVHTINCNVKASKTYRALNRPNHWPHGSEIASLACFSWYCRIVRKKHWPLFLKLANAYPTLGAYLRQLIPSLLPILLDKIRWGWIKCMRLI